MCPLDPALLSPPYARFQVSRELADEYIGLFVNRRAYSIQSKWTPDKTKVGWYLACAWDKENNRYDKTKPLSIDNETIRAHIDGKKTINLYAINPETQRSKWLAIDADYDAALPDLVRLQSELERDGVSAAIELSRRGGHLWIFAETPLLASDCRIYIYNLALRLGIPVKGGGLKNGLEVFPLQDTVAEGEYGNALRAPLGVHRRVFQRYWFMGANWDPEAQMAYLLKRRKLSEDQLKTLTVGMSLPEAYLPPSPVIHTAPAQWDSLRREFRILDHVQSRRKHSRNYWAQCPSCAQAGRDRHRDNLAIQIADPRFYKCWAGCSSDDIRQALGQPKSERRFA